MRYLLPIERIAELGDAGLNPDDVASRRQRYGANDILAAVSPGWQGVLRETARDPMIWFLIGCAVLFAGLGEPAEALILAAALLPLAGMDAYLHRRTQASTEGLAEHLAARVPVLRGGRLLDLPTVDLVPGDLVRVDAALPFPADGLIVAGDDLQVDEAALTGEALPVRKRPFAGPVAGEGDLPVPAEHWGTAGTRLLTGSAWLRVVFTGAQTTYGQIVRLAQGSAGRTPLQQSIGALVAVLVVVASLLCLALAITRYLQGHGIVDALLSGATLAVAALPEEFPVVFTFFLGVGVYRLARRQALVRRAAVVEGIGRVTCICSDKTGTLTEGRLSLTHRLPAAGVDEARLLQIAATAARADSLDPMDVALLGAAVPLPGERLATFPFTEDRRRETAIVRTGDDRLVAAVKGAPEVVLDAAGLDAAQAAFWRRQIDELASSGHKVIACAERVLTTWTGGEPDRECVFLGLLAFEDPLRDGVPDAVARARAGGIRVIMITGDHPATACAIAREAGIGADPPRLIEGAELAARLQAGDRSVLEEFDVVARAFPAQKLDLVRALRDAGDVVAVTGDGVNDVPALQGADVGIAMGARGTRSAREAAAIVLSDDNFRTIVCAIGEGRQLFRNLRLSFAYLLTIHLPLVLTAALVPFAGFPLVYLPAHIVWLELIIHPTALLVFQQLPASEALAPISRSRRQFFSTREWIVIVTTGMLITLAVAVAYVWRLSLSHDPLHARSLALAVLIGAGGAVTLLLAGLRSAPGRLAAAAGLASAVLLIQNATLAKALHLSPLTLTEWLLVLLAAIAAAAPIALAFRPRNDDETRRVARSAG